MILKTKLFGRVYEFKSVKEVLAKANEYKSGDQLAGVAAESSEERVAAKVVLSQLKLSDLFNNPVVPYEEDEVTRIIIDDVNLRTYEKIKNWTVSELREWILDNNHQNVDIQWLSRGLTSEMVAAVAKLMTNLDLIVAANKIVITNALIQPLVCREHSLLVCNQTTLQMILMELWPLQWKVLLMDVGMLC